MLITQFFSFPAESHQPLGKFPQSPPVAASPRPAGGRALLVSLLHRHYTISECLSAWCMWEGRGEGGGGRGDLGLQYTILKNITPPQDLPTCKHKNMCETKRWGGGGGGEGVCWGKLYIYWSSKVKFSFSSLLI